MATTLQRTQQVLPEYQERFLKDLLANVYQTDPETGAVSGIAATSPLYGQAQYDEQGNLLYRTPEGGTTIDPTMAARNQQGQPMELVVGGVPRADIMQFTPAQQRAAELMTGRFNPETGQYEGGGIGLYQPMMEQAEQTFTTGLGSYLTGAGGLMGTTGAFDPTSYRQFYDPFVEDVIRGTEADLQRQADIERQRIGSSAVQAGHSAARVRLWPSRSCSAMLRSRWRTPLRVCARRPSPARRQQAQSAFENQMARGQTGCARSLGSWVRGSASWAPAKLRWAKPRRLQPLATSTRCSTSAHCSKRSSRLSTMYNGRQRLKRRMNPSSGSTTCPTSSAVCPPRSRRWRPPAHLRPIPWLRSLGRRCL
jgi:hypothetical protein